MERLNPEEFQLVAEYLGIPDSIEHTEATIAMYFRQLWQCSFVSRWGQMLVQLVL